MFRYDLLTRRQTGPMRRPTDPVPMRDEPQVWMASVRSLPAPEDDMRAHLRPKMQGTGTATSSPDAVLCATGEALERLCSTIFFEEEVVWAAAEELGSAAVALESFPRCSQNEYDDPKCPLHPPKSTDRIRWARAVSLLTGEIRFLPLRSVFITPAAAPEEEFLHTISTGCAAHTDYTQALISATLEIIERDALSLIWLQRLSLPKIDVSGDALEQSRLWRMIRRGSRDVRYHLFDATTDLKIPVVYGLRRSEVDRRVHTLVACAASTDVRKACNKAILELSSFAVWMRSERNIPLNPTNFNRLHHGPVYMGRKSKADAFQFLLHGTRSRRIPEINADSPVQVGESPTVVLEKVIRRLNEHGHEAFAADLTTREASQTGMRVVRVVIPSLMPFSCIYRARFLGHPRLYSAPEKMGYAVNQEEAINHLPQPFG